MTFDRSTKRISTRSENVLRVADFYRRQLAKIDTPKYKANREHARMLDGYLAGMRDTMRALFGQEWDRIEMVSGNLAFERGESYLDLMAKFAAMGDDLPLVEDIDRPANI